jgi:hypothetical protein
MAIHTHIETIKFIHILKQLNSYTLNELNSYTLKELKKKTTTEKHIMDGLKEGVMCGSG